MFSRLVVDGWRQFGTVAVEFHPRLTVLTGANGAGKTTILNILNRHAGWSLSFLGAPQLTRRGAFKYFTGLWRLDYESPGGEAEIGRIEYESGGVARLQVPRNEAQSYHVNIHGQEHVPGVFIPSHRPVNAYQAVSSIPTSVQTHTELFNNYLNELRQRYQPGYRSQFSPAYRMKEALISLATFGYGNQAVQGNAEYVAIFEGFSRILRIVLPESLGFRRMIVRVPEIVLETETGDFTLDSVSGGILSIIDMAWQLHMMSQESQQFAVMIDEPENHLHPTMQRTLLSDFMEAFPHCQFIVATHNPFIVTAVADSNVYVLDYDGTNHVNSHYLDLVDRAGSSNEVLRDVLGVDVLMPRWVERRLDEIISRHTDSIRADTAQLSAFQRELEQIGLGELFPEAVSRIADDLADDS